jgi:uncharacterized damage-inducible protein DinB
MVFVQFYMDGSRRPETAAGIYTFCMSSLESMVGKISVRQLFLSDLSHSAWANQQLLDACAERTSEELERSFQISHSNILATLRHLYDGERVWLDCLRTTAPGGKWTLPTGEAPKLTLHELRQTWPELWSGYIQWLEGLAEPEAELLVEVFVVIPDGSVPLFKRRIVLRHVLDHSQFHRGQVVGMIRGLGHTPPPTSRADYWLAGKD